MVMELYLFLAMFLIYVLTAFMVKPHVLNRIWSLAFVVCFAVTAVAIAFIRISGQDVMMSANELNWYYLLLFVRFAVGGFGRDKSVDVSRADFSYFLFIARRRRRYGEKFPA